MSMAESPDRRARKAEATRRRILDAARDVIATGGPEALTIRAVSNGADIAVGTFYNYFPSVEQLTDEVVFDLVETFGQRLDALTGDFDDAAEVYAVSLRHLATTAISDPVWGWLLVRLGLAHAGLLDVLGPRANRDIQKGVDSGRFDIDDVALAGAMTFGALLSAMRLRLERGGSDEVVATYTQYLLRMVGISREEARDLARRPLPPLPPLDSSDGTRSPAAPE